MHFVICELKFLRSIPVIDDSGFLTKAPIADPVLHSPECSCLSRFGV